MALTTLLLDLKTGCFIWLYSWESFKLKTGENKKESKAHFYRRDSATWVVNTPAPLECQAFSPERETQRPEEGMKCKEKAEDSVRCQHHGKRGWQRAPSRLADLSSEGPCDATFTTEPHKGGLL